MTPLPADSTSDGADRPARTLHSLQIGAIGTLLLMNVYAPQSLLPLLAREFGVGAAQIGSLIGSTTLAMALFAPFAGVMADAFGRRRMLLLAFAFALLDPSLPEDTVFFSLISARIICIGVNFTRTDNLA